jgi:polar amino acid transport system permease protein
VDAWTPSPRQLERLAVRRRLNLRGGLVATAATVAVIAALVAVVLSSPGWPRVRETFFSWADAKASFPDIAAAFWLNVQMFLIAEPLILVLAVLVAVSRGTTAAALFPVRALAVVYTDLFRGVPTLLVVFLVCFGIPALRLQGLPNSLFVLGIAALVLSYGAYVAEVFRAGSSRCTPRRSPAPTRSGSRTARRCATSCCRRRYAAWCRRCSTTSCRCRRTPR